MKNQFNPGMSNPYLPGRFSLLGIIGGLMVADHLGDVHDELNHLCDLAGIPRPEGNYLDGWTNQDWHNIHQDDEDDDEDEE